MPVTSFEIHSRQYKLTLMGCHRIAHGNINGVSCYPPERGHCWWYFGPRLSTSRELTKCRWGSISYKSELSHAPSGGVAKNLIPPTNWNGRVEPACVSVPFWTIRREIERPQPSNVVRVRRGPGGIRSSVVAVCNATRRISKNLLIIVMPTVVRRAGGSIALFRDFPCCGADVGANTKGASAGAGTGAGADASGAGAGAGTGAGAGVGAITFSLTTPTKTPACKQVSQIKNVIDCNHFGHPGCRDHSGNIPYRCCYDGSNKRTSVRVLAAKLDGLAHSARKPCLSL